MRAALALVSLSALIVVGCDSAGEAPIAVPDVPQGLGPPPTVGWEPADEGPSFGGAPGEVGADAGLADIAGPDAPTPRQPEAGEDSGGEAAPDLPDAQPDPGPDAEAPVGSCGDGVCAAGVQAQPQ